MSANLTLPIQSTADFSSRYGVKCIVYGRSGVGKTRLGATAPRPIIFSAEAGLMSVRDAHLPYYEISTIQHFESAIEWAEKSTQARQFDTIVLDSLSEIAEQVLTQENKPGSDGRQVYGKMADRVINYVRRFRALQYKHVIVTAKEEFDKVDGTNVVMWQPMFPGKKLGKDMAYYWDLVFRLEAFENPGQNQKWTALRTAMTSQITAKDRSGALEEFEPPDMNHVISKIMAKTGR